MPQRTDRAVQAVMREFAPSDDRAGFVAGNPYYGFDLPPTLVPDPPVLYHLLHHILGFTNLGRFEKTAWECTFTYRDVLGSIADQKMGVRLYVDRRPFDGRREANAFARELRIALRRALGIFERGFLRRFAAEQLRAGNVTFLNQAWRLREMHEYHRECAQAAYEGKGRIPKRRPDGGSRLFPGETEGFYNTVAMVAAYFSWLEHVMVLAHPFTRGAVTADTDIADFMRLGWRDKVRSLFDLRTDAKAVAAYKTLLRLSDAYRNPWVHGALDTRQGAVGFHLPGSGAVSMALGGRELTPSFFLLPFDQRGFAEVSKALQQVDRFLRTHYRTRLPMRWIEGGLDVAFDVGSRAQYALALQSPALFDDLMKYSTALWERHVNMEW